MCGKVRSCSVWSGAVRSGKVTNLLLFGFIINYFFDIITTWYFVHRDGLWTEQNSLVIYIILNFGYVWWFVFKVIFLIIGLAIIYKFVDKELHKYIFGFEFGMFLIINITNIL